MIQFISGMESSATALAAERARLEVISQNIANANTTRGLDGKPYQRQRIVFESVLRNQLGPAAAADTAGVRVARVEPDPRPPRLVHQPGHPDADANGMVALPAINIHEEMVDLLAASRAFEANLAVIRNARQMALQTLSIGKRA
jgi:flagellar basal-body rod protein FlgC